MIIVDDDVLAAALLALLILIRYLRRAHAGDVPVVADAAANFKIKLSR